MVIKIKNRKMAVSAVLVCVLLVLGIRFETNADILEKKYSNTNFRREVGTLLYLTDDINTLLQEAVPKSQGKMKKQIDEFVSQRTVRPYFEDSRTKEIENVLLIQLEGVDGITPLLRVNGKEVMPNLSRLKRTGLYFLHAYDQSGSGRTSDGEFLALTSLLPVANESMYLHYSLKNLETLPEALADNGFHTISLHGYEGAFYQRKKAHKEMGYQDSFFLEELEAEAGQEDYLGWGLSDAFILKKTAQLLSSAEEKTFVHTILLSNHHPFDAVTNAGKDAVGELLIENPQSIVENYFNSVHYTDACIGELLEELKKEGILEKTLLVFFSDHDSGITREVYEYCNQEYDIEDPESDRVVLLLYDGNTRKEETFAAGQADIMPLILSYLGYDIPQDTMGLNYIDGQKVVYKQNGNMYNGKEIRQVLWDMDSLTKSIVNYKGAKSGK